MAKKKRTNTANESESLNLNQASPEEFFYAEEQTLLVWQAPSRPFKTRSRDFFTTIGAIVALLSIILLFAQEFMLLLAIWALSFASYAFATVKPEMVEHEITNRGIRSGGDFFRWAELGRFWFSQRHGSTMVSVETYRNFPHQIVMLIDAADEQTIKNLLRNFLLHENPEPGFLDKASQWLGDKVPLEN